MNKEWFKNVIIFSLAEPGAMGIGGLTDEAEIYGNWFERAKVLYCRENNAE